MLIVVNIDGGAVGKDDFFGGLLVDSEEIPFVSLNLIQSFCEFQPIILQRVGVFQLFPWTTSVRSM